MEILSPEKIKRQNAESDEESYKRSQALAVEESRLARAINEARQHAKDEIDFIDSNYKEYKTKIEIERKTLTAEVEALENRKKEALKPIEPIRAEAAAVLESAKNHAAELIRKEADLEKDKEKNRDYAESLNDFEDTLKVREQKIASREAFVQNEEARLQQSAKTLAGEWADLHKAIHSANIRQIDLDKKEARLVSEEKIINIKVEQNYKIQQDISNDRKAIQDGYENLRKARKEILGRDD